uniref:Heme-binding protein n=1 Tax=Hadrurus spadix TaxID=141984 RepID=A0A1W7RAF3_9SCOR
MKVVFVILFAIFSISRAEPNCTRNGVSCPDYEVLENFDGYEKRRYPEVTLVSINGTARERRRIIRRLILRLYRYIGGFNREHTQIELMVPVRTLKVPGDVRNGYTISFFLPKEYSSNPPIPLDSKVFLQKEPITDYAVRSFGNFVRNESIWDKEAETLFGLLPEDEVDTSNYFWAVYDPPVRLRNRLNEVWVRLSPQSQNLIL